MKSNIIHSNHHSIVTATESPPISQIANECLQTLRLFIRPGQVTQLFALKVRESGLHLPRNVGGYYDFDHPEDMARSAAS